MRVKTWIPHVLQKVAFCTFNICLPFTLLILTFNRAQHYITCKDYDFMKPDNSTSIDTATLRLIDANANRAREGIRTAEDYIRFTLAETVWARELKEIRGDITKFVLTHFTNEQLVASRNSVADSGRAAVTTETVGSFAEHPKSFSQTVAQRGLKRGQEALRVLEEYLRAKFPSTAEQFSKFRYRLYDAEQWLVLQGSAFSILKNARVYVLLTARLCKTGLFETAKSVLKGGCKLLQLREKDLCANKITEQASELRSLCHEYNAVLICNDRIDVALAANAAGVHLGQDDLAPDAARRVAGYKLLIGRSTHTVEQAVQAAECERADYIGIGSMYDTATKPERTLAGLKLAEQVAALKLPVPVFAIGGINEQRVNELKSAGVTRIAVSSAVISSSNPEDATRRLVEMMA